MNEDWKPAADPSPPRRVVDVNGLGGAIYLAFLLIGLGIAAIAVALWQGLLWIVSKFESRE